MSQKTLNIYDILKKSKKKTNLPIKVMTSWFFWIHHFYCFPILKTCSSSFSPFFPPTLFMKSQSPNFPTNFCFWSSVLVLVLALALALVLIPPSVGRDWKSPFPLCNWRYIGYLFLPLDRPDPTLTLHFCFLETCQGAWIILVGRHRKKAGKKSFSVICQEIIFEPDF